jgi:hypothetical protein
MSDDVRLAVINERPGREAMLKTETQAQAMQATPETQTS